ncbi:hypothetical protein SAICODRAFT_64937 [Saitoella complicata NRRL Y-17804]|nr:uncharacterized protein SAICODRAFT_64937 [Saitoella complicata NRRL Y-17804]ODQ54190.1 hypothetical protein SAICODRAFT_64937 [Saitoella complicata NRRL Y-17804]
MRSAITVRSFFLSGGASPLATVFRPIAAAHFTSSLVRPAVRMNSTTPPPMSKQQVPLTPQPPSSSNGPQPPPTEDVARSKLPKGLRKYADRFKHQPISHIASFIILHELTAIVPLPFVFFAIHSLDLTIPTGLPLDYIDLAAQKVGNMTRTWGWEGFWGDKGVHVVYEAAAAYAIVKAMLPLRVALSLWMTPFFARRVVVPVTRFPLKLFRRNKKPVEGQKP